MSETLTPRPVVRVDAGAKLSEAAEIMCNRSVGAVTVFDGDDLRGIFTERDLTFAIAEGKMPKEVPVAEVVNDFPIVVAGPVTKAEAARRMTSAHVRHLIVKDDHGYGIVSIRDLVDATDSRLEDAHFEDQPSAEDIMSSPVVTCRTEARLDEVAEIMAVNGISGLAVVDDNGKVVGVVSERDVAHALGGPLIRLTLRRPAHGEHFNAGVRPDRSWRVGDVMSKPAIVVVPGTPLPSVADVMRRNEVNRVPVVRDGRAIGMVTRGDILHAICRPQSASHSPVTTP